MTRPPKSLPHKLLFVEGRDGRWTAIDHHGRVVGGPSRTAVGAYEQAKGKLTLPPPMPERSV